ncbi:MAG: GNAT family N-acetyltransferase [Acidobacteriota bacterium]
MDSGITQTVRVVETEGEAEACWAAFHELRPHLTSAREFVERWRVQVGEGYRVICVMDGETVASAAGYRFLHTTAWGWILYIDDLVTVPAARGRGYGSLLLRHLQEEARRLGCDAVHLDTGYQRHAAHRVYLENGFSDGESSHGVEGGPRRLAAER